MHSGFCLKKHSIYPGTVAHACNPGYYGGRAWKECGRRPMWAKVKRLGGVVLSCNPNYTGTIWLQLKCKTLYEK
jgi:hypothetical protein